MYICYGQPPIIFRLLINRIRHKNGPENEIFFLLTTKFETLFRDNCLMSDKSVNVESRTSSQDKRWTIMAALLVQITHDAVSGIERNQILNKLEKCLFQL